MAGNGVKDEGQTTFADVKIHDPGAVAACELIVDNREAASAFAKGGRDLKEILPAVTEPTQFVIGEGAFLIEVTPGDRNEYTVEAGTVQRKSIKRGDG